MSTPRFKFYLTHPIEGEIEIDEPVGWKGAKFVLKRDQNYHGVNFEYSTQIKFYRDNGKYNGGAEFILMVEQKYGIDTDVLMRVDISSHGSPFETFFTGRLNLEDILETQLFVECNAEQLDFYTTFNQRTDLPVAFDDNISVDGVQVQDYDPYTMSLHSKVLLKQVELTQTTDALNSAPGSYIFEVSPDFLQGNQTHNYESYLVLAPPIKTRELSDFFELASGVLAIEGNGGVPGSEAIVPAFYEAKESGVHDIDVELRFNVILEASNVAFEFTELSCGIGLIRNLIIDCYWQVLDANDVVKDSAIFHSFPYETSLDACDVFTITTPSVGYETASFQLSNYNLEVGDKLKIYTRVFTGGSYKRGQLLAATVQVSISASLFEGSFIKVTGKTFGTDSSGPAIRLHDVFQNLVNKLTNRDDTFYSEYFGYPEAPYHSYLQKGCGADFSILNGFNIRNFPWPERPLKPVFENLYSSIDAIFGIGLSLETIEGNQRIRIENLPYYYQKDEEPVLVFDNIAKIQRTIDKTKYYNRIDVGYEKWQPEEINGLDEFATVHNYALPLKTTGKPKVYMSKYIASGSIIEVTRRMQYNETVTTDSKYDEDNFIIALNKSNPATAEKDENFDTVNNLLSPDTAYNLRLSPARNLLRHGSEINGCLLKKLGESYKFTAGQGNYKMESEMSNDECPGSFNNNLLVEDQDIQWAYSNLKEVDPLWEPEVYEFKYPLGFTDYKKLKDNPYRPILISGDLFEEGKFQKVYLLEVEYEPVIGLGKFRTLKASTLPYNYVPEDADNLLLQNGFDLLLEDGGLLLL